LFGGAILAGLAARGMVRVARALTRHIDEQNRRRVLAMHREQREAFRKFVRADEFDSGRVVDTAQKGVLAMAGDVQHDREAAPKLFHLLDDLIAQRQGIEREEELKPYVSNAMAEAVAAARQRAEQKPQGLKDRSTESDGLDTQAFNEAKSRIEALCLQIEEVYPEAAAQTRARLLGLKRNKAALDRVLEPLEQCRQTLQEKAALYDLAAEFHEFHQNDVVLMLQPEVIEIYRSDLGPAAEAYETAVKGIERRYALLRQNIELGSDGTEECRELAELNRAAIDKAIELERTLVFVQDLKKAEAAFESQGLTMFQHIDEGDYLRVSGWSPQVPGQRMHILFKKPDRTGTKGPEVRIDGEGFEGQWEMRKKLGLALSKELLAQGIPVDWKECLRDRKGRVIADALEDFIRQRFPSANVKVLQDDRVSIDGAIMQAPGVGDDAEAWLNRVSPSKAGQKERARLAERS